MKILITGGTGFTGSHLVKHVLREGNKAVVLDNQEEAILSWKETGYRFVKRQSQMNPTDWVSLGETRVPLIVAGTGH